MKTSLSIKSARPYFLLVSFVLVGCTHPPSEFTVDYYLANDEARRIKLRECGNDVGALQNDPLCVNAKKAESLKGIGSLHAPPRRSVLDEQKDREQRRREK